MLLAFNMVKGDGKFVVFNSLGGTWTYLWIAQKFCNLDNREVHEQLWKHKTESPALENNYKPSHRSYHSGIGVDTVEIVANIVLDTIRCAKREVS